jgi:hypothetical protein
VTYGSKVVGKRLPVGLQGNLVEACDLAQVALKTLEHLQIAFDLVSGNKRMDRSEFLPRTGLKKREV